MKTKEVHALTVIQKQIQLFMSECGQEIPIKPVMNGDTLSLRIQLIQEEQMEFTKAAIKRDMVEMIDALCDLIYVTVGTAVALGIDLGPFFEAVHVSNMTKVKDAKKNKAGKILKGPHYVPPHIHTLFKKLYEVDPLKV